MWVYSDRNHLKLRTSHRIREVPIIIILNVMHRTMSRTCVCMTKVRLRDVKKMLLATPTDLFTSLQKSLVASQAARLLVASNRPRRGLIGLGYFI